MASCFLCFSQTLWQKLPGLVRVCFSHLSFTSSQLTRSCCHWHSPAQHGSMLPFPEFLLRDWLEGHLFLRRQWSVTEVESVACCGKWPRIGSKLHRVNAVVFLIGLVFVFWLFCCWWWVVVFFLFLFVFHAC